MLMKCICDFVRPDSGRIFVAGKQVCRDVDFPPDLGLSIETPGFVPYYRGLKNLELLAAINRRASKEQLNACYAAQHGFTNCVHYADDGWSGGNFERPDWKRLIAGIEAGKTGCVIAKTQVELDAFEADTTRVDQFLALARKYTDFSILTTPMIYEFVDKILVHAPDRSSGERTQEVDIYLKFIGKFDVPMPEPTPEELAELEKRRKQRAYYREKTRRYAHCPGGLHHERAGGKAGRTI